MKHALIYCIQKLELRDHKLKIIPSSIVQSGPPESKKMKEKNLLLFSQALSIYFSCLWTWCVSNICLCEHTLSAGMPGMGGLPQSLPQVSIGSLPVALRDSARLA